jgi:hypothetical protein
MGLLFFKMIKLKTILIESINFTNWKLQSDSDLEREFRVEHELKGLEYFETAKDFIEAIKKSKVKTITKSIDSKIENRSRTESFDELLSLIKGYRSYPKYRNAKTLKSIYKAFESNSEMDMPIILRFKDGSMQIFSGNTRMDIAFQLKINPKAIILNV